MGHRTGLVFYWTSDERRCVSIPNNLNNNFYFLSLFHFLCALCSGVRRGNGKHPEEGREGQLNGGCLVSIPNSSDADSNEKRISISIFLSRGWHQERNIWTFLEGKNPHGKLL